VILVPDRWEMIMPRTDREIAHDIAEELRWDPGIDATGIRVAVKRGIVTLAGAVGSQIDKYEAEQLAKRIAGVFAVVNDIEVLPPAGGAPLPASHGNIRATVCAGWITLEGTAESIGQRQAAEDAVRRIKGVKGVTNLVAVKSVAPPDAKAVKRKIEEALRRSAEIRANSIQVESRDGRIVLTGTVRSWIEREEAERAARAAPGVADVEDCIVVCP
jgi:osmotically-inducible protein OsmY